MYVYACVSGLCTFQQGANGDSVKKRSPVVSGPSSIASLKAMRTKVIKPRYSIERHEYYYYRTNSKTEQ